jgi:hypothetical protein
MGRQPRCLVHRILFFRPAAGLGSRFGHCPTPQWHHHFRKRTRRVRRFIGRVRKSCLAGGVSHGDASLIGAAVKSSGAIIPIIVHRPATLCPVPQTATGTTRLWEIGDWWMSSKLGRPPIEAASYRALKPASAAIPTATAEKQHDDNDDQKSCGVHSVLRKSPNQGPPQGASGCIAARAHVWARSRKAFLLSSVLAA